MQRGLVSCTWGSVVLRRGPSAKNCYRNDSSNKHRVALWGEWGDPCTGENPGGPPGAAIEVSMISQVVVDTTYCQAMRADFPVPFPVLSSLLLAVPRYTVVASLSVSSDVLIRADLDEQAREWSLGTLSAHIKRSGACEICIHLHFQRFFGDYIATCVLSKSYW